MKITPFLNKGLAPHYYVQYVEQSNASSVEKASAINEMLSILWRHLHPNDGALKLNR